jgi:nucleoside-diphosphate-sugar epimerase
MDEDVSYLTNRIDPALPGGKYIITGATGLIGGYLVESLLRLKQIGYPIGEIIAVSRGAKVPKWLSESRNITRAFGDLSDMSFLSSLPKADVVVHAAGYGQPGKFLQDPISTFMLNTVATDALAKLVRKDGSFLFLSTSEVYSGLPPGKHKESEIGNTNTNHVRSCYIEGKRGGEAITHAWAERGAIAASAARLALAYGPGTQAGDNRVLNEFIERALTSGVIELRDSGDSMRTYCYVRDAVELIFSMLSSRAMGNYNVGGVSRTSILNLADEVARATHATVKVPIRSVQLMDGAPQDVALNLDKIVSLGVEPNWVPLKEGIKRTVSWQKSWLRKEDWSG